MAYDHCTQTECPLTETETTWMPVDDDCARQEEYLGGGESVGLTGCCPKIFGMTWSEWCGEVDRRRSSRDARKRVVYLFP